MEESSRENPSRSRDFGAPLGPKLPGEEDEQELRSFFKKVKKFYYNNRDAPSYGQQETA